MFDEGMISFEENGQLIIRNNLDQRHLKFIDEATKYKVLPSQFLTNKFL